MIVVCPGCSGIDVDLVKKEFKNVKIIFGCIGECGGRMDGTIVAMVDGSFIEAKTEKEFIIKARSILNLK